jgi:hypothetical protein
MSFCILDPKDSISNYRAIVTYIDNFAKECGISNLTLDERALLSVSSALEPETFPHVDGVHKASPFKKASYFFVWFVALRPILEPLPLSIIPKDIQNIDNHQNVILGYHFATKALHKATIKKPEGEIILNNRIRVSNHFFKDFIEAYQAPTPESHFKMTSLLFEQLAYKANPNVAYKEII